MRTFIKWLSNIKFAIFILGILIICSFIGSIFEQTDKPIVENLNTSTNLVSEITSFFGFSNIFNNIWFFSLNLILGLSLISCTFT